MKEITRGDIKAVLATVTAGIEANRVHSVISKFFFYALDEEIITAHPMVRMKKQHRETARDRVLSGDEIKHSGKPAKPSMCRCDCTFNYGS